MHFIPRRSTPSTCARVNAHAHLVVTIESDLLDHHLLELFWCHLSFVIRQLTVVCYLSEFLPGQQQLPALVSVWKRWTQSCQNELSYARFSVLCRPCTMLSTATHRPSPQKSNFFRPSLSSSREIDPDSSRSSRSYNPSISLCKSCTPDKDNLLNPQVLLTGMQASGGWGDQDREGVREGGRREKKQSGADMLAHTCSELKPMRLLMRGSSGLLTCKGIPLASSSCTSFASSAACIE